MKKWIIVTVAIGLCLGMVAVTTLRAQRPAAAPWASSGVALVDVMSLTQHSTRLEQSLKALKAEYEQKAASFKEQSARGNALGEKLRTLPPNTPEYKKLEQELFKMRADFELEGKRVTEEAQDRESAVYYDFSRQLQSEMNRFAQATGAQLVLRYDPTPDNLTDPQMVLREVQKLVVYQRGLDVTPTVQDVMNRQPGINAATRQPSSQPARR